ncbi:hypothetical protein SESBI_25069 [Sesbania bispinosa]|nr:hypothetical protein SESBI_25069 [Sesbania bispinosa]
MDIIATQKQNSSYCNTTRLVAWIPPPEDFIALNTDGSSIRNPGQPGIGGIRSSEIGWVLDYGVSWKLGNCRHPSSRNSSFINKAQISLEYNISQDSLFYRFNSTSQINQGRRCYLS